MIFRTPIKVLLVLIAVFFFSCDKEFEGVGTGIIDNDAYDTERFFATVKVLNNVLTGPVETSNLPLNTLGVYNDPLVGVTSNSFVTQLELAAENPTIGTNPTITDVVLSVPYFATFESYNADNVGVYRLDSIYGNSKVRLNVYESGYYIRDFASDIQEVQAIYSDEENKFVSNIKGTRLNNSADVSENEEFFPSALEKIIYATDGTTIVERLTPRMYLHLDKTFFQQKILNASPDKLLNNNIFKEYFRGLFFNVEQIGGISENEGLMMKLDFSKAQIKITYEVDGATATDAKLSKEMYLNLKGHTANFFNHSDVQKIQDKIVLKGGKGAFAQLQLFTQEEINLLKAKDLLINEANLIFYVDQEKMANVTVEPNRLFVYDIRNHLTLDDYALDRTVSANTKFNKSIFDGKLQKNSSNKGIKYRVRITKHIQNIINKDSANVELGLTLTENINLVSFAKNKSKAVNVLKTNTMSSFGTVLQASETDADKKIQLEIFYSTPKK